MTDVSICLSRTRILSIVNGNRGDDNMIYDHGLLSIPKCTSIKPEDFSLSKGIWRDGCYRITLPEHSVIIIHKSIPMISGPMQSKSAFADRARQWEYRLTRRNIWTSVPYSSTTVLVPDYKTKSDEFVGTEPVTRDLL